MKCKQPRVSVGLPVYNRQRYVAETIESHLAQTFADFEFIICDNASSDGTEEICRAYARKDSRIRYVRNAKNLGAAKNYRLAFELSSGEYFKWASSDDLCGSDFLARCVSALDRDPSIVLAYPKTKLIDGQGQVISEYEDNLHLASPRASDRFAQLFERLRLCNALYGLIRASALRKTASLGNYIGGDIPLLAELTLYGQFCEIPEFLFFRRLHQDASSSYVDDAQILQFYDPKNRNRPPLTEWRHFAAYLSAVTRAPIGVAEKALLFRRIARMGMWSRNKLALELTVAVRHSVRRFLEP